MAIPFITQLPEAPQRSDARPDFALRADVFFAAIDPMRYQMNQMAAWMNDQRDDIYSYSDNVEAWMNATLAARNAAQAAANNAAASEAQTKKYRDDTAELIQNFDPSQALPTTTVIGAPLVVATEQGGVRFADDPLTDVAFTSNAGLYDSFFNPPVIVADSYTAKHRDTVIINTTTTEVTVTLPASPAINTRVRFVDYFGGWSKKNAIIDRNGQRIAGVLENLILNVKGGNPTLIYTGSAYGWAVA